MSGWKPANTFAKVSVIPPCDICTIHGATDPQPAQYDAFIPQAHRWGCVCTLHFDVYQCRLGVGLGQQLVLDKK